MALRTLAKQIGIEDTNATLEDTLREGYERELERDLVALERGLSRYLSLKYMLEACDYDLLVKTFLRGIFTKGIDMGVRSKMCRGIVRLLDKRDCVLSFGMPWRAFRDLLIKCHVDCADGAEYIGREIREPHGKHLGSVLLLSRFFLKNDDCAEVIWNELVDQIDLNIPEMTFVPAVLLSIVLPTHGDEWTGWVEKAIELWGNLPFSTDWDSIWISLLSRVAADQPGKIEWTPFLSKIYERMMFFFRLPLGGAAPHSPCDKRCPAHCHFLLNHRITEYAPKFIASSLSPEEPESLLYLKRFIELIANFFHPSNGGRWSTSLASFIGGFVGRLTSRVTRERSATEAGVMGSVAGSRMERAVAESKHRLSNEYVEDITRMLMPILEHGLHSKDYYMTVQAACACRDLAILAPDLVVHPLLKVAAEGLESVSSPHRTSAALKMLATLAPVFLDPSIHPDGLATLPQALELTLPGIDPNDPSKTEATFRFIAGASARLQALATMPGHEYDISYFLEDYVYQLLERIFALLESLEAPPKKSTTTGHYRSAPLFSIFVFTIAMENLFGAISPEVACSAAEKIANQISGSAVSNALKFYGVLVRTAASAAASATNSSSAHIFMPLLIGQLLETAEESDKDAASTSGNILSSLSEEELVWRIRMLAQASRACYGFGDYAEQLCEIAELAMRRPSRKIYKAGARLLRGMLEGLNATTVIFGGDKEASENNFVDARKYSFKWREPGTPDWEAAENIVKHLLEAASKEIYGGSKDTGNGKRTVLMDRESLFRALRMLHGIQRGSRWLFAGVTKDDDQKMTGTQDLGKENAKYILRRPVVAGLGAEQSSASREKAIVLWAQCYQMVSDILKAVMNERPDDGALLYRALEPIELANEPFRRTTRSRYSSHTCKVYKAMYTPVIASKRAFGTEGGVGRFMPRFIVKLRIEALHEHRLSHAARPGVGNRELFTAVLDQLAIMSVNDFPRVRVEARGAFTRAMRVAHPKLRRNEINRLIATLTTATEAARAKQLKGTRTVPVSKKEATKKVNEQDAESEEPHHETFYEKMIGAADALRSNGIAPIMMRDWELLTSVLGALLKAQLHAELPEAINGVSSLFMKLGGLARPLGINRLKAPTMETLETFVGESKPTLESMHEDSSENLVNETKLDAYEKLNNHLLGLLSDWDEHDDGKEKSSASKDAHWRLQSLVATTVYTYIRVDRPPSTRVAKFFAERMISDLVSVRQTCCKAVALMLVLHGMEGKSHAPKPANDAVTAIKTVLYREGYARKFIHILALDHDEHGGGGASSMMMMNFIKQVDGNACWALVSGKPWPASWTSRSRDTLALSRVRLYEFLFKTFGFECFKLFKPHVEEILSKLKKKEEHIITGVKDDDVRVVVAEIIAGMGRGLGDDSLGGNRGDSLDTLSKWMFTLMDTLTGPQGMMDGSTFLRLLATAEEERLGRDMASMVCSRLTQERPLVVPMDAGAVAHVQARRIRYLHACIADVNANKVSEQAKNVASVAVEDLTGPVAFSHESKTVREEVARCVALVSSFKSSEVQQGFSKAVDAMSERLSSTVDDTGGEQMANGKSSEEAERAIAVENVMEVDTGSDSKNADSPKKVRSREGETLSRMVSLVYWSGESLIFTKFIKRLLPALFRSVDDNDKERISYAQLALSLVAQAKFDRDAFDTVVASCEDSAKTSHWKIREAVLPFVQVLAFTRLFSARAESLARVRHIVLDLLADPQLEVREEAGEVFVPLIRDAPQEAIAETRDKFLQTLKETSVKKSRRRSRQGQPVHEQRKLTSEELLARHGAVLGLSSMVISSPYSVPSWMPSVLVALTRCIEDTPPIAKSAKKLFADFWRTHRDEWQKFKHAFTEEQLDSVSELLISPSYYA